jgi:hypothetical protein
MNSLPRLLDESVSWSEEQAKNLLQYFFQSSWQPHAIPQYDSASEGPPHMKTFRARVTLPPLPAVRQFIDKHRVSEQDWLYGYGEAKTKKDAEKQAAHDACKKLLAMRLLNVPPVFRNAATFSSGGSTTSSTFNNMGFGGTGGGAGAFGVGGAGGMQQQAFAPFQQQPTPIYQPSQPQQRQAPLFQSTSVAQQQQAQPYMPLSHSTSMYAPPPPPPSALMQQQQQPQLTQQQSSFAAAPGVPAPLPPPPLTQLESDRAVVIVGAGTMLGLSLCRVFASAGYRRLAVIGRNADKLQRLKDELVRSTQQTIEVQSFVCDVTDMAKFASCIDQIRTQLGTKIEVNCYKERERERDREREMKTTKIGYLRFVGGF